MNATPLPKLPERMHVTGLAIDPIDLNGLFEWVVAAAKQEASNRKPRTVGYLNVHVANVAARDPIVKKYINELCDLVYCDGKGIGWGAWMQGLPKPPRLTAADWLPALLATLRDNHLRTFVVAGKPGVADRALDQINQQIGGVGQVATHDGYLTPGRISPLRQQIAEFQPHVVLVGMGTPTQETWTLSHRHEIVAPVVWTLGAAFDYYAGEQSRGPAWLHRAGHEWAARLVADPQRLWQRYLIGNPQFLLRALRHRWFT